MFCEETLKSYANSKNIYGFFKRRWRKQSWVFLLHWTSYNRKTNCQWPWSTWNSRDKQSNLNLVSKHHSKSRKAEVVDFYNNLTADEKLHWNFAFVDLNSQDKQSMRRISKPLQISVDFLAPISVQFLTFQVFSFRWTRFLVQKTIHVIVQQSRASEDRVHVKWVISATVVARLITLSIRGTKWSCEQE